MTRTATEPPHNASTYRNHGCRCATCVSANTAYGAGQRQLRASRRSTCLHAEYRLLSCCVRYGAREICRKCGKTRGVAAADVVKYAYQLRRLGYGGELRL